MIRAPREISRSVELRCGFVGEDGQVHIHAEISPLTMLEALQMEAEASTVPEDLSVVVEPGSWATLCRSAAMIRQLGDIPGSVVTARLLLELQEIDALLLAQQCKEVSLAAATFRGGAGRGEGGDFSAGHADGLD